MYSTIGEASPRPFDTRVRLDDEAAVMDLLSRNDRLVHPPETVGEYPYEEDDPWYEESF